MADAIRYEVATLAHAEALAATMRQAGRGRGGGRRLSPLAALLDSLRVSSVAHAALLGTEVLALYGVVPVEAKADAPQAVVWALTGAAVERHRKKFHREAKRVLRALAADYPRGLYNYVDSRHAKALRWARRLGFVVLPAVPYGPHRMPFHPIVYVPR